MTEILNLLERAKKDKKKLIALKNMAVKCQDFELASKLREMEVEYFPETESIKQEKKEASELCRVFQMVELNVSADLCWLISNTIKVYSEKKGEFALSDAMELIFKKKELYEGE